MAGSRTYCAGGWCCSLHGSIVSSCTSWGFASALYRGAKIGPGQAFYGRKGAIMAWRQCPVGCTRCLSGGEWWDVTNRFLGLKFKIKGKTHYGWARLSVHLNGTNITSTLTGYAYETIPNKPIITGKTKEAAPATLGALAMGAPGLSKGGGSGIYLLRSAGFPHPSI